MFKIVENNNPALLSDEVLASFEALIGANLPQNYRTFLKQYNGGHPEHEFFHSLNGGNIAIHGFCGIKISNNDVDISEFRFDDPLLDRRFIAIGFDGCGNYICLRLSGDNAGKIYFLDHDTDQEIWDVEDVDRKKTKVSWKAFYKIQNSFQDLISANYIDTEINDDDYPVYEIMPAAPLPRAVKPEIFKKMKLAKLPDKT